MVHDFLQNPFIIQGGLLVGDETGCQQIWNGGRVTERQLTGVQAAAKRTGQNFPDRDPVGAERFSQTLGLLDTPGGRG